MIKKIFVTSNAIVYLFRSWHDKFVSIKSIKICIDKKIFVTSNATVYLFHIINFYRQKNICFVQHTFFVFFFNKSLTKLATKISAKRKCCSKLPQKSVVKGCSLFFGIPCICTRFIEPTNSSFWNWDYLGNLVHWDYSLPCIHREI